MLWGKDVLSGLTVARDHLRLRCEQEIENLLLRLRQFYLLREVHSERIEGTLASAISSFLTGLAGVLILTTGRAPIQKAAIAEAASRELSLDEKGLQDLLALKAGKFKPNADGLKRLYGVFLETVERVAGIVDRL